MILVEAIRMARLSSINPLDFTEEQKSVFDEISSGPRGGVPGPLAIWLHRPQLANYAQNLGRYCRYESSLEPRLSELAILITAQFWDAQYEWDAHVKYAENAGLEIDVIKAIKERREPSFDKIDESVIYRVARQLNLERIISAELYKEADEVLGTSRLVDLIGLLGYYSLISMTIKAFKV